MASVVSFTCRPTFTCLTPRVKLSDQCCTTLAYNTNTHVRHRMFQNQTRGITIEHAQIHNDNTKSYIHTTLHLPSPKTKDKYKLTNPIRNYYKQHDSWMTYNSYSWHNQGTQHGVIRYEHKTVATRALSEPLVTSSNLVSESVPPAQQGHSRPGGTGQVSHV